MKPFLWVTAPRTDAATLATPWLRKGQFVQGNAGSQIDGIGVNAALTIESRVSSPQPTRDNNVNYLPLVVALDFSQTDRTGTTSANLAVSGNATSDSDNFSQLAYSPNAAGNVVYAGNIDASGSGVIGSTVKLEASGSIKGLVFARDSIDLSAVQNVNVTALAQGNVSVSAGGNVSGTLVGVGSVSASGGGTVDAALLSQNVTTSGDASSAQVVFSQGTAANNATQGTQAEEPDKAANAASKSEDEDEKKLAKAVAPRLTRTTGRVTVLLP